MKRRRHTPEQAVRKVREGERMLNAGSDLTEVLRQWPSGRLRYYFATRSRAARIRSRIRGSNSYTGDLWFEVTDGRLRSASRSPDRSSRVPAGQPLPEGVVQAP